jgi:hypothetical protein
MSYNRSLSFQNSGKPTFGNAVESKYASDNLTNKKAKLLYPHNYNRLRATGKLGNQPNYLLFKKAKIIRNSETCKSLVPFNNANLVSGLYTTEKLGNGSTDASNNINVITGTSYNTNSCNQFIPTSMSPVPLTSPFYYRYNIDSCGLLFGKTPCGLKNYNLFRVINYNGVNTAASLNNCNPKCFLI